MEMHRKHVEKIIETRGGNNGDTYEGPQSPGRRRHLRLPSLWNYRFGPASDMTVSSVHKFSEAEPLVVDKKKQQPSRKDSEKTSWTTLTTTMEAKVKIPILLFETLGPATVLVMAVVLSDVLNMRPFTFN